MREIKFRAWDKEKKKMHQVLSWHNVPSEPKAFTLINQYGIHLDYPHPDFELMQYTGLLDKQGKEIFEGDIVLENIPSHTLLQIIWNNEGEPCFSFKTNKGTTLPIFKEDCSKIEVIGNIYTDNHLLK